MSETPTPGFNVCVQLIDRHVQSGLDSSSTLSDFDQLLAIVSTLRNAGIQADRQLCDLSTGPGDPERIYNLMGLLVEGRLIGLRGERSWDDIEKDARTQVDLCNFVCRGEAYSMSSERDANELDASLNYENGPLIQELIAEQTSFLQGLALNSLTPTIPRQSTGPRL